MSNRPTQGQLKTKPAANKSGAGSTTPSTKPKQGSSQTFKTSGGAKTAAGHSGTN